MAHIHAEVDFVVTAFLVYEDKVLLVLHKKLGLWLGIGGHIELGQTTDEALVREIEEETGLQQSDFTVHQPMEEKLDLADWSKFDQRINHNTRRLMRPWAVEVHDFPPIAGHRHLAFVYLCRAHTDRVVLAKEEHHAIGWFSEDDLGNPNWPLLDTIRHYGLRAINEVRLVIGV